MTWALSHIRAFVANQVLSPIRAYFGLFCPDFYSDIADFTQIFCRYLPKKLVAKTSGSDDSQLREDAVQRILDLRAESNSANQLREFVPPKTLNFNATHIRELIDWDLETISEPPLTYKLSTQALIEIEVEKLTIKPYKVHTQSVERAVKLVTQASISVYGPEARDGFVKATVLSRRIMPKLTSKKDFAAMINKS